VAFKSEVSLELGSELSWLSSQEVEGFDDISAGDFSNLVDGALGVSES